MAIISIESRVNVDNFTEYVCDKFDLQNREKNIVNIPMIEMNELDSFDWNIGVICGDSGSGKSTILSMIGEIKEPIFDNDKAICSQFSDLCEQDACNLLSSVGLSSVPIWLHKPNELSNGEKARLDLCYHLSNAKENEIILIDEFTSVVNRQCAKSMSYALQRYVRSKGLKVIIATCHFDIFEFLRPDWIYNLNKQRNGIVDIERVIYNGTDEYEAYMNINKNDIISNEYSI